MAAHGARGHDIGKRWTLGAAMRREVFGQAQVKRKRGREEEDARKGRDDARKKRDNARKRGREKKTEGENARRKEGNTNVSPSKLEERCTVDAVMQ